MFRPSSRLVALICAVLAVALGAPSAVLAQGPGDDQYTDPFGELPEEERSGGGDSGPEEPSAPPPPAGGGDDAAVAPQPAGVETETATGDATTAPARGAELARTGLPADFLAGMGVGLLCSGVLLRAGLLALRRPAHPFGGRSVLHQAPRVPGTAPRR